MSGIGTIDLNVAIVEGDLYALNALNAYLAWDRRTRVLIRAVTLEQLWLALGELPADSAPEVVLLDANHLGGARALSRAIRNLRDRLPGVMVICLAQEVELEPLLAAAEAQAQAYLLKQDVHFHIGWAIYCAALLDAGCFLISRGLIADSRKLRHERFGRVAALPGPRIYPGLTRRKREALILYAIEGMPHRLIADEMDIEVNTVQSYIKDANQILESCHDDFGAYPDDMSQREITFMRLTALGECPRGCDG